MRRTKSHLALIATALASMFLCPLAANAGDDPREPALRAAELARFQAQVNVDTRVLREVLDDNLEYVHSNGVVDSKASFVESLVSGTRDYIATTASIDSIRIFGDVALIRGTAKVTVNENGQPLELNLGYTDFWVWKEQRWQMTAWRSARMPAAAKPAAPAK